MFLLSYYLTGKAYDFYTQKVAITEEYWTLPQFYQELFDYCFPVDYRMQLRKTLARCHQNDRTVAEYTHELQELFNMIGNVSPPDQVLKFWNGARPAIQKELWKHGLNPELSSWRKVVTQAEIIEISENVAERRDRKPAHPSMASVSGGSSSKHKSQPADGSVRAVSFGSRHRSHGRSHHKKGRNPSEGPSRLNTPRPREGTPTHSSVSKGKSRSGTAPPYNNRFQPQRTRQLSDKEKAEYRAAGKCFGCGKEGHMSRNCPDNTVVKSHGQGPPGTSTFNVEPIPDLGSDSGEAEVLDSLPLGAMCFGDSERLTSVSPWSLTEWKSHYPYWNEPNVLAREHIGDCYAMVIDSILTLEPPFPGDEEYVAYDLHPELRFHVTRVDIKGDYLLVDRLTASRTVLARVLVENPEFDISYWYAEQRSRELGLTDRITHRRPIGDAISIVATKLLTDGISSSYPCTNPRSNPEFWFCMQCSDLDREAYEIADLDLEINIDVPKAWLDEPSFDLVSWYRGYLDQHALFERKYYVNHWDLYCQRHQEPEPEKARACCHGNHECMSCNERPQGQPTVVGDSSTSELDSEWDDIPELKPFSEESEDESEDDSDEEDFFEKGNPNEDWGDMPGLVAASDSEDEDMPGLVAVSDSKDEEDPDERMPQPKASSSREREPEAPGKCPTSRDTSENEPKVLCDRIQEVLTRCQPFPGDGDPVDPRYTPGDRRFIVEHQERGLICVYDRVQGFETDIHVDRLKWEHFSLGKWFAERCAVNVGLYESWNCAYEWSLASNWNDTLMGCTSSPEPPTPAMELGGIQVDRNKYPALQRNAAQVKGNQRVLPKPIVVKVMVNSHPARALLDSGSLGDFMSTTLADQLGVTKTRLDVPLALQLAIQGSRSKVNSVATAQLQYQGINEKCTFDIINLNGYDLILGTPWMHQHQLCIGFNPARVVIGSDDAQPLKLGSDTKLMVHTLGPEVQNLDNTREELRQYADPLCREVDETELPPFRAINHTIPLIDEEKAYPWRPSRCPEPFRAQWVEKRDAYIKSGRWKITSAGNTVPMMFIPKPGTNLPLLRTVVDLRERNKNTRKLTSPLPDMEGMLRRTASKPYRTTLDLKSAYEQIRIVPEHVGRSAVTTPDGNMISEVVQMGDCNAPATHQALMNFLFSSYIGRFMDIYLDDIVIYSDTLEDHVEHVKLVLDILAREKLYLSRSKLHFISPELTLLGRVIDNEGIRMDSEKVDSVLKWKVPTNRDLLRGFIGSVGYLVDDIPNIRIPMGVLSSITGDAVPFRWGYTEQRAFEEVKTLVHSIREHRRTPLDYSEGALPIWMITDGCSTGISGVVSQGSDWKTAKVAAFYSAKLNPAQQNYPVHEIEMLAGVETMLRHVDILQGAKFKWLTDHKGLLVIYLLKNLSG